MRFLIIHFHAYRGALLLVWMLGFLAVASLIPTTVEAQDSARGLFGTDEDFALFAGKSRSIGAVGQSHPYRALRYTALVTT